MRRYRNIRDLRYYSLRKKKEMSIKERYELRRKMELKLKELRRIYAF